MRRNSLTYIFALLLAALSLMMQGCNAQKKNTAAARQYTAFITRYNIYYNGDTHFKETLAELEKNYEDDYTRRLYMHPAEAKSDPKAPQPSGDFTRSIEKAQKAIQIRSIKKRPQRKSGRQSAEYKAWLKRDEYNPFIHNAWMMMGRSQYFNGDFLGAASTFFYVAKHFTWLPATVTEAKLWQARSYLALDWLYEAEIIITRIKTDELTSGKLEELYNFTYADLLIRSSEYSAAVPYLQKAISKASGTQKPRLRFLLGQIYEHLGEKEKAYEAFKKAGSSSAIGYRAKFNARIKQSEVFSGQDIEPEVRALRRMTRYDRNKEYLDQIYYAIGNLYLSRADTARAIENYALAVDKSTRGGIEKALAQITLGKLYFARGDYAKAQPCYSEAVPLLPDTYPDIALLRRRSDVLDELALYSQNVTLQDSLLRLSEMPEDELLKVIDRLIDEVKKKEKEEAEATRREEYEAQRSANENLIQDQNQRQFNINTDNSWYFYNTTTRNSGKTEFQKRWGARKLEDDWRRRNKASFNADDFDADAGDDLTESDAPADASDSIPAEDAGKLEAQNDPHNPEHYLKDIPFTAQEKLQANDIIQEGLYNMGVILKDKLDDFAAANTEFQRLLSRYPDNVYRLDVYYNLYLMFIRMGDEAQAEKYRQLILSDFPESSYGTALRDPNYIENLRNMDKVQERLYEQTYTDYLENRNSAVHEALTQMQTKYPLSKLMPKFLFLDALTYVTENRPEKFNATLRELLEKYPDTDLTPIASAWLKGMAQGRKLHSSSSGTNMRGMIWDMRLGNDSTLSASDSLANFEINESDPQLLVLVFDTDTVNANDLLYRVAAHNFKSFVVKDFDLEPMNFGRLGMLLVKGFDNLRELNHYRRVMAASTEFKLPYGVRPIAISAKNFETLLNEGRSFDDYFRFLEEQNYSDAQADILVPAERETLREAEEAATLREQESGGQGSPTPATATESPLPAPSDNNAGSAPSDKAEGNVGPDSAASAESHQKVSPKKEPPKKELPKNETPGKGTPKKDLPEYDPGSEGDDPLLN